MIPDEPRYVRELRRFQSLLDCPAHMGGLMTLVTHAAERFPVFKRPLGAIEAIASRYTDRVTRRFDETYGTDTFQRVHLQDLEVGPSLATDEFRGWKYGPINKDFFDEMVRKVPDDLSRYTFLDVGCGKGLAIMLASEYPFRRLIGLDFSPELLEIARQNLPRYATARGRSIDVDWVCADFMKYEIPNEPVLFFLNNPFPSDISQLAAAHLEASLAEHPRPAWVVYRRPSRDTKRQMEASPHLLLRKKTPYWVIHQSVAGARA